MVFNLCLQYYNAEGRDSPQLLTWKRWSSWETFKPFHKQNTMKPTNLKQLMVDNYKSVHQSVVELTNEIPWSDIWAKTRLNALKVYRSSSRLYTLSSNWVRGIDWAKQWDNAQNVAALIAAISTVTYERSKPYVMQAYDFIKGWAKKIEWMEVLEIVLLGLQYLVKGTYGAGLWTGRFVYTLNDALAREFVYLTGALVRPAPAAPTDTSTDDHGDQGNESRGVIIPAVLGEDDIDLGDGWSMTRPKIVYTQPPIDPELEEILDQITVPDTEEFVASNEDQATNPFIEETIDALMEQFSESDGNEAKDQSQDQDTEESESDLQNSVDSICTPAVHPALLHLESMTVRQLREISGIFNKRTKKEDLIQAAALALAC